MSEFFRDGDTYSIDLSVDEAHILINLVEQLHGRQGGYGLPLVRGQQDFVNPGHHELETGLSARVLPVQLFQRRDGLALEVGRQVFG